MQEAKVWYTVPSWKKPVWYSLTYPTLFDDNIDNLEKHTFGVRNMEAGCVAAGLDNAGVPLRLILSNLE